MASFSVANNMGTVYTVYITIVENEYFKFPSIPFLCYLCWSYPFRQANNIYSEHVEHNIFELRFPSPHFQFTRSFVSSRFQKVLSLSLFIVRMIISVVVFYVIFVLLCSGFSTYHFGVCRCRANASDDAVFFLYPLLGRFSEFYILFKRMFLPYNSMLACLHP